MYLQSWTLIPAFGKYPLTSLTTFMMPFGQYCYHLLPFGITSAPEFFHCQMSEMLRDKQGMVCLINGVYGATQTECDE